MTEFEYWLSEQHSTYGPNRADWPAHVRETESRERERCRESAPRYFVARSGRAFSCDGTRAGYIAKVVAEGGEDFVLVWDSVAGHYTARHSLTRRQQARIIREARTGPDPIDEPEAWGQETTMTREEAERLAEQEVECDYPPTGHRGCGTESLYHHGTCAVARRADELLRAAAQERKATI